MFGKTQRGVSERPNKPKSHLFLPGSARDHFNRVKFFNGTHAVEAMEPVKPKNQATAEHSQEEDTNKDYRFYDLLPQQQVTPIPEKAVPEAKIRKQW